MASPGGEQRPHVPPPSLWPVGFAVGIAILLTGLVVGWFIVVLGAVLAVSFGFLWIRDVTADMRGHVPEIEPERREVVAAAPVPVATEDELERFPRSKFLEATTLGIGGLITGIVTLPVAGVAVLPAFVDQGVDDIDVGALDDFPEGEWRIVKFFHKPDEGAVPHRTGEGEVARRTAFVRYNGLLDGEPSFTIISNRCVHLGCPVQPGGPVDDDARQVEQSEVAVVERTPTNPAAFSCPCHGGAYDTEGNRTAGPPVRALDRYRYAIKDGRLVLTGTYSVGKVEGVGKEAVIKAHDLAYPGNHVDGLERFLYPIQPPR
jgi:Rieske Fe-S protein